MKKLCASVFVLLGIWIFNSVPALAQDSKLKISLQKIIPSGDDPGAFIRVNEIQE
jgi:hypothetical protein